MSKRLTALIISVVWILVLVGGSAAYKVTSDVAKSRVSASNVKIELVMTEIDASGNEAVVNGNTALTPGETKSRIAKVRNIGDQPAWVRVRAQLVVPGDPDSPYDAMETPYSHLEGLDVDENWTWNHDDGFFYYNKSLEPGQTTEALFTGVVFSADSIDESNGKNIDLKVDAYGTQVKNNGSTVLEAKGWPAE